MSDTRRIQALDSQHHLHPFMVHPELRAQEIVVAGAKITDFEYDSYLQTF